MEVEIIDNEAPVITCPGNIVANAPAGLCTVAVVVPVPVTSDNCGVASFFNDFNGTANASGTYSSGITTVTWTITDINGNTSTCSMTVTVNVTGLTTTVSIDANHLAGACLFAKEDVTWSQVVNCTTTGNNIQKTSGGNNNWNAGAQQWMGPLYSNRNKSG
jgi:hypothetical protein